MAVEPTRPAAAEPVTFYTDPLAWQAFCRRSASRGTDPFEALRGLISEQSLDEATSVTPDR